MKPFIFRTEQVTPVQDLSGTFCPELVELLKAVKRKVRGIEFGIPKRFDGSRVPSMQRPRNTTLHYVACVFYPGEPTTVGVLAWGDPTGGGEYKCRYCLWAPNVTNKKYAWGDNQHLASTGNMNRMVSEAGRYLRRTPLEDRVVQSVVFAIQAIQKTVSDLFDRWSKQSHGLWGNASKETVDTLRGIYNRNPEVFPKDYRHQMQQIMEAGKEAEAAKEKVTMADWYLIFWDTDEALSDKTDTIHVKVKIEGQPHEWARNFDTLADAESIKAADMDEITKERITVLSLLPDSTYVEDVGVRITEGCFFVCK